MPWLLVAAAACEEEAGDEVTDPIVECTAASTDDTPVAETAGLECGDDPVPRLDGAHVFQASDVEDPPAALHPNGYLLVLTTEDDACAGVFGPFGCWEEDDYELSFALPPVIDIEGSGYRFGPTAGDGDDVIGAWLQVGHADSRRLSDDGQLFVEAFNPATLRLDGRICGVGLIPALDYGLSGTFIARKGCGDR